MKKNRLMIGMIYVISLITVLLVVLLIRSNQYSAYLVMNSDGYLMSKNNLVKNMFNANMILEDTAYDAAGFQTSSVVYEKAGKYYMGDDKVLIQDEFPLFVNNESALLCLTDSAVLISDIFETAKCYNGLYINNGLSFNPDMERAYREEFILMGLSNGLYVNTMTMEISGNLFVSETVPTNSILRFMENEIRIYSLRDGVFIPSLIEPVNSATQITIDQKTYGYYDFLEKLGLYEKGELLEKEARKQSKDNTKASVTPKPVPVVSVQDTPDNNDLLPEKEGKTPVSGDAVPAKPTVIPAAKATPAPEITDLPKDFEKDEENEEKDKEEGYRDFVEQTGPKQEVKKPLPPKEAEVQELPEPVLPGGEGPQLEEEPIDVPEEDSEERPGNPDWKKPVVTLGDFYGTVYHVVSSGMVVENAEYLYRTGVSFSIYQDQRLVMRKAYQSSADVSVGPLQPDTEYKVVVDMDYYDKYGFKKTESITEIKVRTRPLSELVPLKLNWSNGDIFYNKIQLRNLSITNTVKGTAPVTGSNSTSTSRDSYIETVQYISRVEILLTATKASDTDYKLIMGGTSMADFRTGKQILYESSGRIISNTEYSYSFVVYDRFGNILPLEGSDKGMTHTCKQPPKAEITITKNEVRDIELDILIKNTDEAAVKEGSIYFSLFDSKDNPVASTVSVKDKAGNYIIEKEHGEAHALTAEINTVQFLDLLDYEVYKIRVYCDYDINNGLGIYEDGTIGEMSFTTMPISSLGYAFFQIEVNRILEDGAEFVISLDTKRTDSRLVNLISTLDISFTKDKTSDGTGIQVNYYREGTAGPVTAPSDQAPNNGLVSMTGEEIALLKTTDDITGESTAFVFTVDHLESFTKYKISIKPKAIMGTQETQVYRDISTYYSPESFMTMKKTPVIEMEAIYASSTFIKLYGVEVNDPDNAIVAYPVTVFVYDDKDTQIATYEIPSKEKVFAIDVSKLTRDKKYTFRFFAKEYNNGYDMSTFRKNYEIYYSKLSETKQYLTVTTKEAVYGSNQLLGLDDMRLNQTLEIPAKNIKSYNSRVTLYQNYRFSSNSQVKAKFSLEVDFGQALWNSFQIGYSYVNRATNFDLYLVDPDKNPGAQPFASCLTELTRGSEYRRWTELQLLPETTTLTGKQTIYIVASTVNGSGGINCLWGVRFHQAQVSKKGSYYADINVRVGDPKEELGSIPSYKLKIYKDNIWVDTRRHDWIKNENGTYTLNMYQVAPDQTLTLVDEKIFNGEDRLCDTDFYYEVEQGHHTYRFELWAVVYNYEISLSQEEFTTEEEILGIRTADELADVRYGLDKKYYVLKDIEFPLGWNNITNGISFDGELDFRGHTLTYNSASYLIHTLGYYGSLKNLVFTYVDGWGSDVERKADRIVYINYGLISNIFASRNNGNVAQTFKTDTSVICHTNNETGIIENFVVEFPDSMIVTNTSAGVCVYNKGLIRNGYVYGEPIRMTDSINITEAQFSSNNVLGGVVAVNRQTGTIENVYSLLNIETRAVKSANDYAFNLVAINDGLMRNCFSVGDVYYGGEIRQDFGPAYRNRYVGSNTKNIFYYSDKKYGNTNNTLIAKQLLYDETWYDRILNASGSTTRNRIDLEPVQRGYYPHVVWPTLMPSQDNISLPKLTKEDQLEILDAHVTEQGQDYAKAVITLDNPNKFLLTDIRVRWLQTEIISQEEDGEFYRVTVRLTQPEVTKYFSKYEITGFNYSLGFRGIERSMEYAPGKEPTVDAEFYKPITKIEEWYSIKDDYTQNYRLEADLDFHFADSKVLVIPANVTMSTSPADAFRKDAFSGKLDGNGHKISGADTGTYGYVIGKLTGSIKNLTIEDIDSTRGSSQFKGFIGRMLEGSLVDNVHVIGMEAVSYEHCGAIAAEIYGGTIANSSAHDIRINTTADGNYTQYVGGLAGKHRQSSSNTIYANGTILNCYVDGLDITVHAAGDCGGVGGLLGFARASADIHNVYVINGKIDTVYKNVGGLIGAIDTYTNSESSRYMLKDYYVDVDITSITERSGGVIGFCPVENGELEENGLVLGNTSTSLPNPRETGRFYGYGKYSTGRIYAYEYSILNGKLTTNDPELLTYDTLCNQETYERDGLLYWDPSFVRNSAEQKQGILPKLSFVDNGTLLPYQQDYHLLQEPIKVTEITSKNYSTGNIYVVQIVTEHSPELTVTGAVFNGLMAAALADPEEAVTITRTQTGTILKYILEIEGYYDAYYLTGLSYTLGAAPDPKMQESYYSVGILPQYFKISSADEWNTLLSKENFGRKRFNIQITGDIDFSEVYKGQAATGLIVNHLMGANLEQDHYFKIKGIDMNNSEALVKAAYGNISYLDFEDISYNKPSAGYSDSVNGFGLLEAVTGDIHHVSFTNTEVKAYNSAYVGIVGLSYGMNYQIELSNITVYGTYGTVPAKRAVGGLIGRLSGSGGVYDTRAEEIVVQGREYTGGIIGIQEEGRYLWNINVNHAVVYSTNGSYSYVGGIIGSANATSLSNVFGNCSIKNAVVVGNSYTGGVVGLGSTQGDSSLSSQDNDKYKTLAHQVFVTGTGAYVGGIAGQGVVQRAEVRNAYVYGLYYIGGLTGNGSCYYGYVTDSTIGSVYDRMTLDTGNQVFQRNVNDRIAYYQELLTKTSDQGKLTVYMEAVGALRYLTTSQRNSSWSVASFTGNNNTRIGGISGRTISIANSLVVNSRIGSFGAVAVGGLVARTELSSYNTGSYRLIASGTQNCEIYGAENVGGIVGDHWRAYIESCYSNSNVTATRANAGGIAGSVEATNLYSVSETPYFINLYYLGTVTAPDYVGGIVGRMKQDLYNVNQGLLVGGNVVATTQNGRAGFFMNKNTGDARALTDCLVYEDATITFGSGYQKATNYYQANPTLLLKDDISLTTTAELKLRSTYTDQLGWNTDAGTTASNYKTRYFNYNGLVRGYMPYLTGVPTNSYDIDSAIRILPYQEGYMANGGDGRALLDSEGLYVYKFETYDGGIPIPGSGASVVKKRSMFSPVSEALPRVEFYAVDADQFNLEFTEVNPEAEFKIFANDVEVVSHPVDRRTFTIQYDYKTELTIVITEGMEELSYSLWPEDISRNVMTWNTDYYYLTANTIEGSSQPITGQYLNLYAGHGIDVYGTVIDVETGEQIRTIHQIELVKETVPLYHFEYDGYRIQTFQGYSLVNGVYRDKFRMYVKNGELSVVSSTLSMIPDSLILENYNGSKYCSVLSADGTITDMTDSMLNIPEEFDNQDIQYMTHNMNSTNHILLVRYYDGAVAGFNYITGELLPIDSIRGTTTTLQDIAGSKQRSSNISMTNFATLYVEAMDFKTNLIDIGWEEVSGVNLVGGEAVSAEETALVPEAGTVPVYVESTFVLDDGTIVANNAAQGTPAGTGTVSDASAAALVNQAESSMEESLLTGSEALSVTEILEQGMAMDIASILAIIEVVETYGATGAEYAELLKLINERKDNGLSQTEIDRLVSKLEAAMKASEKGTEPKAGDGQDTRPEDKNNSDTKLAQGEAEADKDKQLTEEKSDEKIKGDKSGSSGKEEAGKADKTEEAEVPKGNKFTEKEAGRTKKYIAVYDTGHQKYLLYEEKDLLVSEDKELTSVNEKVERSGHMIDYKAKQKADIEHPGDSNIYGYILISLAIVGIALLFSNLVLKKQREAAE